MRVVPTGSGRGTVGHTLLYKKEDRETWRINIPSSKKVPCPSVFGRSETLRECAKGQDDVLAMSRVFGSTALSWHMRKDNQQ